MATAIETAKHLPGDVDMIGKSMILAGTYQAPGAETSVPFALTSQLTWGKITALTTVGFSPSDTAPP